MQKQYTKMAQDALDFAKKESKKYKHGYIGTEHILLGLLKTKEGVAANVLENAQLTEEDVVAMIEKLITPGGVALASKDGFSPRATKILSNSMDEADRFGQEKVGTEHLLLALIKDAECVAFRLLHTMDVNIQKIYVDLMHAMGEDPGHYKEDFQNGRPVRRQGRMSMPILSQYGSDLTEQAEQGELDPVIGREPQLRRVIQILSRRTKNNPCLIGEPGVGKTAIVEALAQRIAAGNVPQNMLGRRLITLDLSAMVAGSKYRGEFEERMKRMMREVAQADNVLLFIDEIHTMIGAGGAEGAIDASNILKPALARGEIQVIGATTIEEYRKHFEKDAALERRFQPVTVEETTKEETVAVLEGLRSRYEQHHHVSITKEAMQTAVEMSIRYINDRFLPDKAIDVIDEAASRVRIEEFEENPQIKKLEETVSQLLTQKEQALIGGDYEQARTLDEEQKKQEKKLQKLKEKQRLDRQKETPQVTEKEVAQVVSDWTKVPVQQLEEKEYDRLLKLEKGLHQRVIGQDEAVSALSRAVKRSRVGLKSPDRPIGSFLFLGPTGVGKTELSKALAATLFGSEQALIRVDMSEYMEKHSISKIIGSPPGYVGFEEGGQLSEKVRRNPYSIILFDEIEKAHPDVFNLLLQVLDDGHITDAQGRKVDFKNTVIIMTSNAGAKAIVAPKKLGFLTEDNEEYDYQFMKDNVMEEVKRIFKPEFLNRIDETIVFHLLKKEDLKKIVTLLLKDLTRRCKDQLDITLTIRDSAKQLLVEQGSDLKYGARPLRRTIQSKLEDTLAEELLLGRIKRGDQVAVAKAGKELKFIVQNEM